jgi:hypothetical protein
MSDVLQARLVAAGLGRVVLRIASPAQLVAATRTAGPVWAEQLTVDEYVEKEAMLNRSEHAQVWMSFVRTLRPNKLTSWCRA